MHGNVRFRQGDPLSHVARSQGLRGARPAASIERLTQHIAGVNGGVSDKIPKEAPPKGVLAHRRALALSVELRVISAGPLVVLFALWMVFGLLSPYFLTRENLTNILIQSCIVGLLALASFLVIMVGSLDISLGATVSLSTLIGAVLIRDMGAVGWLIIPIMIGVGMAVGLINSLVIIVCRINNAFIVTLGMLYVVQSAGYVVSSGSQQPFPSHELSLIANGTLLGVPGPIILLFFAGLALSFFIKSVVLGRWIVAIGGNRDAALKVGIPVRKVMFSIYIIAGAIAGLTGALVAGLNSAGTPDAGGTTILFAIAAVVIGGANLAGGRGSVWSTLVGVVILATISNGLALLSVPPTWTPLAIGGVLVAAVGLDTLRQTVEGRLRVRQAQVQGAVL
ncbi:putative membrane protein [Candidatus Protofrankia californiensis]|uniref:Putative membrane protein n=1 Tax=Candidatus Protofrankia californiensis TaxID=1839754 RepID=A0A1C3NXX1_9ACTN|nr:putative membrane protein [Candidatus Protofrankia californiensis]